MFGRRAVLDVGDDVVAVLLSEEGFGVETISVLHFGHDPQMAFCFGSGLQSRRSMKKGFPLGSCTFMELLRFPWTALRGWSSVM